MDSTMHAKALARADRIDRTFFMRNGGRTTYVRPSLPYEAEGHGGAKTNEKRRLVVVASRHGGLVRIPFSAQLDPDPTEAAALAIFQFAIDRGREIGPSPEPQTIEITAEEARRYTILAESTVVLSSDPELDADAVVHVVSARYDRRHPTEGDVHGE